MSVHYTIIIYVLAMGFVSAGLLNAVHQAIMPQGEDENGHFILYFDTIAATAWSIVICLFAGPFLVLKNAIRFWRNGVLPTLAFAFCILISILWSFCSGVLIFEAGISLGIFAT